MNRTYLAVALIIACYSGSVLSHGDDGHEKRGAKAQSIPDTDYGRKGDPRRISRTVRIDMSDKMRFTPDSLVFKRGETVKFVVKNGGMVMHEMVIGTMSGLKEHAELMRKHPGMEHDEENMAHVAPGKAESLVWQFTKAGEFHFGCLIPGHFESGMVGRIVVKP